MQVSINGVPIGTITAPYGSIDEIHKVPHRGIDIYFPEGYELYAPLDGVVSKVVENHATLGNAVYVHLPDGKQYLLAHLSKINVHIGEKVTGGKTLLGLCGSTGHSTGSHLHFSVIDQHGHFIDPYTLFERTQSALFNYPSESVFGMKSVVIDAFNWVIDTLV